MFLLKTHMTVHEFDIVCLTEKYLDPSTRSEDNNLEMAQNVCIYYKKLLP